MKISPTQQRVIMPQEQASNNPQSSPASTEPTTVGAHSETQSKEYEEAGKNREQEIRKKEDRVRNQLLELPIQKKKHSRNRFKSMPKLTLDIGGIVSSSASATAEKTKKVRQDIQQRLNSLHINPLSEESQQQINVLQRLGGGNTGRAEKIDVNGTEAVLKVISLSKLVNQYNHQEELMPDLVDKVASEVAALSMTSHINGMSDFKGYFFEEAATVGNAQDSTVNIVMSLAKGESLIEQQEEIRQLPVDQRADMIANISIKLVSTLAESHDNHVFHRDLSLNNIFLDKASADGVTIIDMSESFIEGVSQRNTSTADTTTAYGPPSFERFSRAEADLYSLANIMLDIFNGSRLDSEAVPQTEGMPDNLRQFITSAKTGIDGPQALALLKPHT